LLQSDESGELKLLILLFGLPTEVIRIFQVSAAKAFSPLRVLVEAGGVPTTT
jgi:hypothetical protein